MQFTSLTLSASEKKPGSERYSSDERFVSMQVAIHPGDDLDQVVREASGEVKRALAIAWDFQPEDRRPDPATRPPAHDDPRQANPRPSQAQMATIRDLHKRAEKALGEAIALSPPKTADEARKLEADLRKAIQDAQEVKA